VKDADDFDAGTVGKFPVEYDVVAELGNDPGSDIFSAAETPLPPQRGITREESETVENSLLDAIRCLGLSAQM
jgi:hypothetical protein